MVVPLVAADDGVRPQTKGHLHAVNFLKVKGGAIVFSKADAVDPETLELAEMEIRDLVEGSVLQGKPIIHFSAKDGRCLDHIRRALQEEAGRLAPKDAQAPFRMWIDRSIAIDAPGALVTGIILSGAIRAGEVSWGWLGLMWDYYLPHGGPCVFEVSTLASRQFQTLHRDLLLGRIGFAVITSECGFSFL
jgi:selenocysteine-specific translation elongation factor